MRRNLLVMVLGLALSGVAGFSSAAAGGSMKTLPGHVPPAVSKLQALGLLPETNDLRLAIGLPLRNREALTNLLREIYDPASPHYRRYLTPEEFTALFGPTEQEYQAVADFAGANGLKVTGTHPNRVVLDVSGRAKDVEKAFRVTLRTYKHPKEARDFFAPDTQPAVDAALPILDISGLDNYSLPQPKLKVRPLNKAANAAPALGSGPYGTYMGSDFRKAYAPGTSLNGAGQNVGLLQFDGFYASDIAAYVTQIGLTSNVPQLVVVPVNGGVPVPTPYGNPEVSMDIELIMAMSPGVSTIYVYEAPNPSPWVDLLSKMANDNLAKQLSCSWGGGPPNAAAEQIFQQMALQGQSFFNASGDYCAFNSLYNPIQFPEDSPHITQVGGTFLTTGAGASYASETVWNRAIQIDPGWDGIGSAGGISTYYSIPTWQTNVNFAACQGSSTMRNIPDVALTAEDVYVIYGGGQIGAFGGTSAAAPLWAGFTALINQQAVSNSLPVVGFINPAVYTIAKGPNYTNCFHDITTGNNTWSGSPSLFYAVANYDLCTGLGTPRGTNLINALASTSGSNTFTHLSPPPPPYGSTLAALNGGNPNGAWQLFIQDDTVADAGTNFNGWILTLTTANPVGAVCDLALSMTASATNVQAGNNLVYVIGVTNYGISTASNALVAASLSSVVNWISTNTTQGSVSHSGLNMIWNVGTLASSAGARLTLTVQPTSAGTLDNYAIASTITPDPNPDDDYALVNVNVNVSTPPQFGSVRAANGQFILSITSPPAPTIIQLSTNLITTNWVNVYTGTPPFWYTNWATNPASFYRGVVAP